MRTKQLNIDQMRNLNFIIIAAILMISCASKYDKSIVVPINQISKINDTLREKYSVVSDFLDTKIKDRSKKIMIHNKKINPNMTLRILRLNDIYVLDSITGKYKEDKTFYEEDEWEIARKKYSKNSIKEIEKFNDDGGECCWNEVNFNFKNIIFEEFSIGSPTFVKKYYSIPNLQLYPYYYFSEPIYYQNKEYIIFTIYEILYFDGLSGTSRIIIYKKKNGKWVQTHEGLPNWFS